MPYKKGSLKGQLTTAEIRKLISAHNKLSKITIPPRSTRDDIMKIISKSGFRVNHEQQKLEQTRATKKDVSLEKAKETTKRVPKTEQQKQQSKERMEKKKIEKEKELKLAKKEGVKEFKEKKKQAEKKKPVEKPVEKPKKKTSTMGTQTDDKPKPVEKKKPLQIEDKKKMSPQQVWDSVKDLDWKTNVRSQINRTFGKEFIVKDAEIKDGKIIIKYVLSKSHAEFLEDDEDKRKKLMTELSTSKYTLPGGSSEKSFKVERTERSKMINQLKQEYGNSFNPFKILGITAREETPELVKQRCRELRLKEHPDKGGDKEKFDKIQKACDVLTRTQTILKKTEKKTEEKKEGQVKKKVGRPVGSKTILNFSKLKKDVMDELFKEIGVDRENFSMKENREKLKSLFMGEDFKLKETIKKEEYEKLPDAGKIFYSERKKREKKEGYTQVSGLGIYDVENKDNIGKDKKYFIDKINKFMNQK